MNPIRIINAALVILAIVSCGVGLIYDGPAKSCVQVVAAMIAADACLIGMIYAGVHRGRTTSRLSPAMEIASFPFVRRLAS